LYGERVYTDEYEKNRNFETLYVQDRYLHLEDFKNGVFLVRKTADPVAEERALGEVGSFLYG